MMGEQYQNLSYGIIMWVCFWNNPQVSCLLK